MANDGEHCEAKGKNSSENADSYSWDFGDGMTSSEESPIHTYDADGNYSVTVTDAHGCADSTTLTLSNIGGPTLEFDSLINETCTASNGSIFLNITGATSISWSTGATTEDITGLDAGTYYVTATNGICPVIDSFDIIDITGPSLTASQINSTCNLDNGSISLTVTGGTADFTYNWETVFVGTCNFYRGN